MFILNCVLCPYISQESLDTIAKHVRVSFRGKTQEHVNKQINLECYNKQINLESTQ